MEFMWMREVDVPAEVMQAARAGSLVIFVGAGASRDEPSGLPDFRKLIEDVGDMVGKPPIEAEARQPDVFLGRLADTGVDVHQLVANAINQPGSTPNRLHRAIVRLASVHPTPRIVTTNYDVHLTTAAKQSALKIPVFKAPALPVGDDFEGIVHLHGAITQEARRLVVTDTDFGRAYLREAWAARFLERMFSNFTVLFVGYSHGDVVMQYLARSLGSAGTRFVLTHDGENAAWRSYGLTPITYPSTDSDHSSLPDALERWAEIVAMGHTEHRALVAELLSGEPPTIPEEVSYLEEILESPDRIGYFTERARGPNWFNWASERPVFQGIFGRATEISETTRAIVAWVADHYMLDQANSPVALRVLRKKAWHPDAWQTIAHRLVASKGPFPDSLAPWLLLTLQNVPDQRSDLLDLLLAETEWGHRLDLAIMLLENRTDPVINPTLDFGSETDPPRFELDLYGDEHWLSEAWAKVFKPALDTHLTEILASVDSQISRMYRVLRALRTDSQFDSLSFSRSAIELHEQDSFRDAPDVLIDAARDCIEHALVHSPQTADRYIQAWSESPAAIPRRLALHAWRAREDKTADEKLKWLRQHDWLWDIPLQHEVFLVLKVAVPAASETEARLVVEAAKAGPPQNGENEISPYRSYNLLAWLAEVAPALTFATEAFEQSQEAHPEYAPRSHPDLNSYMTSGFVEDALPLSPDEVHSLVSHDPAAALADLRDFNTDTFETSGPTWSGALQALQACVALHPADGLVLAQVLLPEDVAFRTSIIHGWDKALLEGSSVDDALAVIESWDRDEIRDAACKMLSNGGNTESPTPWHRYSRARLLATQLWPTSATKGSISGGNDLVLEAINHPAGDLTEFWTKVVQWEWSENQDSWDGLPDTLAAQLDTLVMGTDRNSLLARTLLASQLHFLFGADPKWCTARLLPFFEWTRDADTASAAWQGFLTWGRPNDGLLEAGLLDGYIETSKHSSELSSSLQHQLTGHLASIAMFASPDPASWLTRFVIAASEELRVSWSQRVATSLAELDPDESALQWSRWIATYWSARNQSIPLPFTSPEASATARWVLGLPTFRTEAIDLVLASPACLDDRSGMLHRIHDLDLAPEAADWTRFLTHLLQNTAEQSWGVAYYLKDIVPKLRFGTPPPDLTDLINEAMRLGAIEAPDW